MRYKIQTIFSYYFVYAVAFEDFIFVSAESSLDMVEKGKSQYQLLRERANLPQYGSCWKHAVEYVDEGCRNLSEETQSDIALHLMNCFLEMSGHESYNCALDKKPNLRAICLSSMTDRAFNVYTEFYTHTQNMCWFLRGQIWQEIISENTLKVGKQLEESAKNQELLLNNQKQSLLIQEKMMEHGKFLGKVMEDLYISSETHKELIQNLQSWLIGEVSWFNTIIFYVCMTFLSIFLTSTKQTSNSRLPILFLMFLNCILERVICYFVLTNNYFISSDIYKNMYSYVWYCRYFFIVVSVIVLLLKVVFYKDFARENNKLLETIHEQNCSILNALEKNKIRPSVNLRNEQYDYVNENTTVRKSINTSTNNLNTSIKEIQEKYSKTDSFDHAMFNNNSTLSPVPSLGSLNNNRISYLDNNVSDFESPKENGPVNKFSKVLSRSRLTPFSELQNQRYNLRTRSKTPDLSKN